MIFRIVLDANHFRGRSSDRLESQEFASLKNLAKLLEAQICIPEPVVREVIQGHREALETTIEAHKRASESLRRYSVEVTSPTVDIEASVVKFQEKLDRFLADNEVRVLSFPTTLPPPSDLFDLACRKMPPFDKKGQSYRDAVIAYGLAEFAKEVGKDPVMFISDDKNFRERVKEFCPDRVFSYEMEEAQKTLTGLLGEVEKLRRQHVEQEAKKLAEGKLKELGEFAAKNADFKPTLNSSDLISIDGFTAEKVAHVIDVSIEANVARFTVLLLGRVIYTARGRAEGMRAALLRAATTPRRVGDRRPPETTEDVLARYYSNEPTVSTFDAPTLVSVNCESPLDKDSTPTELRILKIEKEQRNERLRAIFEGAA